MATIKQTEAKPLAKSRPAVKHYRYAPVVEVMFLKSALLRHLLPETRGQVEPYVSVYTKQNGSKTEVLGVCDFYKTLEDSYAIQKLYLPILEAGKTDAEEALFILMEQIIELIDNKHFGTLCGFIKLYLNRNYPFEYIQAVTRDTGHLKKEPQLAKVLSELERIYQEKV